MRILGALLGDDSELVQLRNKTEKQLSHETLQFFP